MNDFIQIIASLREQMEAKLSRSDALKPLAWPMGMLLTALLGSAYVQAHYSIQILLGVLLGLNGIAYFAGYAYCLLRNPDSLRSERYTLHKMALEQRLLGDSSSGLFEEKEISGADTPTQVEQKQ